MFGRAFLLSTFIVAVIFVSTVNATTECTFNGKEVPCDSLNFEEKKGCTLNGKKVPCDALQELSSRQKRSVTQKPECAKSCIGDICVSECTTDITMPAAPGVSGAPAALETTTFTTVTTTASDSIKNGYGICLMVASIFAYLFFINF